MNSKILEELGLSKNEAKIYLALIKLGSASVSDIAKKADVHRVNIYDSLERLQEKGLVASMIKVNKKYFEAANPENLKKFIYEKEEKIKQVKLLVPELSNFFKNSKKRQEVKTFKGPLGIKTVLKGILDENPKEILDFGATKSGLPFSLPFYADIWEHRRAQKGIGLKIITSSQRKEEKLRKKLMQIKYVEWQFNSFSSTIIYNDKVIIVMWTEDPIAIIIESEQLAEGYKNYFYSLWKIAKE